MPRKVFASYELTWPQAIRRRSALEEQAVCVGAILERECEVEFGHVDLRPHA